MARKSRGGKQPSPTIRPTQNRRSESFEFDSPLMSQGIRNDSWPQNEEIAVMGTPADPMGFIHTSEGRPRGTRRARG